jgi:hypothetical protein
MEWQWCNAVRHQAAWAGVSHGNRCLARVRRAAAPTARVMRIRRIALSLDSPSPCLMLDWRSFTAPAVGFHSRFRHILAGGPAAAIL